LSKIAENCDHNIDPCFRYPPLNKTQNDPNSRGQSYDIKRNAGSGTDVTILKKFSPKNLAKILASFAQNTARFLEKKIK
jgi:hypothetical protein